LGFRKRVCNSRTEFQLLHFLHAKLNMPRRKHEEEHENHERWLVSYADFITLLFAFFVVMYSVSQLNEGKYRVLSDSLLQAFKPSPPPKPSIAPDDPRSMMPISPIAQLALKRDEAQRRARAERMRSLAQQVMQALAPLVQSGQVRVTQSQRGIAVEINASLLFKSAQAALEPDSQKALIAVGQVLGASDNAIEVEGHTDRDAISTPQFPSNWELSGARASSVVRLFIDNGVAASRLVAIGYADTRPVDSNDTLDGRSRNRRVTVLIRPETPEERARTQLPESLEAPAADAQDQSVVPKAP
jgi:chemotaxis protein MotB